MNPALEANVCVLEEQQVYTVFGDKHRWTPKLYKEAKSIALEHAKTNSPEPVCCIISNQLVNTFECLRDAIAYRNSDENHVWFHIIAVQLS